MAVKGILLDTNNDLMIERGTFKVGNRKMQDAYVVLSINQGEAKADPIAGANLDKMIRGRENKEKIRKTIEIALERVGIRLDEIKSQVNILINKNSI